MRFWYQMNFNEFSPCVVVGESTETRAECQIGWDSSWQFYNVLHNMTAKVRHLLAPENGGLFFFGATFKFVQILLSFILSRNDLLKQKETVSWCKVRTHTLIWIWSIIWSEIDDIIIIYWWEKFYYNNGVAVNNCTMFYNWQL